MIAVLYARMGMLLFLLTNKLSGLCVCVCVCSKEVVIAKKQITIYRMPETASTVSQLLHPLMASSACQLLASHKLFELPA